MSGDETIGIVLAGGSGSRLYPSTIAYSKQLIHVYDKPLLYYPLSTLMIMGIRNIILIVNPDNQALFRRLLGDGTHLGLKIKYVVQQKPNGIPEAFILAKDQIRGKRVALILGDNLFYSNQLSTVLRQALSSGANYCFACQVSNPENYGVIQTGDEGEVIEIVEKPKHPSSSWVVPGLYVFNDSVVELSESLVPSPRGELEIADLLNLYIQMKELTCCFLERGVTWMDAGTPESLLDAANFVHAIEVRQGNKVGCVEEIALRMGFIDHSELVAYAMKVPQHYKDYLLQVAREK